MRLADRMYRLKTESAFVVLAKAKELEREGRTLSTWRLETRVLIRLQTSLRRPMLR
jgi:hypothetical protein